MHARTSREKISMHGRKGGGLAVSQACGIKNEKNIVLQSNVSFYLGKTQSILVTRVLLGF